MWVEAADIQMEMREEGGREMKHTGVERCRETERIWEGQQNKKNENGGV